MFLWSIGCIDPSSQEIKMDDKKIACEITVQQDGENRPIAVVTLVNTSDESIHIESRHVFFDSIIKGNNFRISLDGDKVPYIGRMVKRRPSGPNDYISIPAGERIAFQANLPQAYKLEGRSGQLQVQYSCINTNKTSKGLTKIQSPIFETELK